MTKNKTKLRTESASDFLHFVSATESLTRKASIVVFRGQAEFRNLVPRIARPNKANDSTVSEKRMLEELRRTGSSFLAQVPDTDWDLLVVAQHFSMATRLLDWTSNPLAALWFACADRQAGDTYVYALDVTKDLLIPSSQGKGPFDQSKTRVFQPRWNNPRIVAQHGWFTAHRFSKTTGRFVPLESNPDVAPHLTEFVISANCRIQMLKSLDRHGISSRTLFPDLEGLCRYLTWLHEHA